jgi:hypothetical protein
MGANGVARAQEFSWERVTAKVDEFYGVVVRRLAARGALPEGYAAPIPPSPRVVVTAGLPVVGGPEPATDEPPIVEPEPAAR